MKTLIIDIETSPNLAHVWGLWNQNVGLVQLRESTHMMCFAAKWAGATHGVEFYSEFHNGQVEMVDAAWKLLDEADAVVHFNGTKFDIPHLNREFAEAHMYPPSPFAQIDLLRVVKKKFRFPSNKLDYVAGALGLGHKASHGGHQLWIDCLAGDRDAWETMMTYNMQDVILTEDVYTTLLPWIDNHPVVGLYTDEGTDNCPTCGSDDMTRQGFAYTRLGKFQRYRCGECGKWSRDGKRLEGAGIR